MVTLDMQMESEAGKFHVFEFNKQSKGSNGRGINIDGRVYHVTCPRYKECKGPTYNQGFKRYLCVDDFHPLCPAINPYICEHPEGKLGQRVKNYSKQAEIMEKMREAGANYA